MSSANKAVTGTGVALGAAVAAWLGASIYGANVAEKEIKAFANLPSSETGVRVHALKHEAGMLSSSGSFGVEFVSQCGEDLPATGPVVEVQYAMSHLILPTSAARVEWSARPAGELATAVAELLRGDLRLTGEGAVALDGAFSSSMALPELALNADGSSVTLSPSRGALSVGKTTLGANWTIDRLVARGGGEALELSKLVVDMDLSDRKIGAGTTSLSIDKIATSYGTAEGFRHGTLATANGERLDLKLSESLRKASFAGQDVQDLKLELAVQGLDKQSIETIGRVAGESCGLQNLTSDEDSRFRGAVRTLLAQGFSLGVTQLGGTVGKGTIEGKLMLEARKADNPAAPIKLAKAVRSSGELLLKGEPLPAEQKQMVLELGVFEQLQGALKASFEYGDGLVRTNGRVLDAGEMQGSLQFVDAAINTFLETPLMANEEEAAAPPAFAALDEEDAEEAVAEAPSAAPAEAEAHAQVSEPGTVAAAEAEVEPEAQPVEEPLQCISDEACLWMTLLAAANEDIETVRNLAVEIEALPKPAPGNRAVSRKLNDEGLAALKADQPDAAAALFLQGLNENPRDVELAGNLGFALVKAGRPEEAADVLARALRLDPRRSSTWTPLAEALALAGFVEESQAALWVAYQWSGNRDKSLAYYADRAAKEQGVRPALATMFSTVLAWVTEGRRPELPRLAAG